MTFFQVLFLLLLRKFFYVKGKRPGSREGGAMPAEQPVQECNALGLGSPQTEGHQMMA